MKIFSRLRKSIFGVNDREALFSKRGFHPGAPETTKLLESVGKFFLRGYHAALEETDASVLTERLDKNDKFNGFCYEGAAMALTILDSLSIFKKDRLRKLIGHALGNNHLYMLYVGVGWGFARLPVSIEKKIEQFDPLLRWLIIDGYGFHQAYFKTKKYVDRMQLPEKLHSYYAVKVFYQGVGRCLWFIECASSERIAKRISGFPEEFQPDLWSGAGLACTYACGADEPDIIKLKELSGQHFQHLAQGAVFAAKARERAKLVTEENEIACRIICSMPVAAAARIADRMLFDIPEGLSSEEQYECWRHSIRNLFIKTRQYEPVI